MKSLFRYFGSKWKLSDWIIAQFPRHECYVELFAGSGAVLLNKEPSAVEIYNDIDQTVYSFFRCLRDEEKASQLMELIKQTPYHINEYMDAKKPADDDVERMRRYLIRQNMCMSPNDKRWGKHEGFRRYKDKTAKQIFNLWNDLPNRIKNTSERLQKVIFENADAIEIARIYDSENTLFYVDPPYLKETRYHGKYIHDFSDDQHKELLSALVTLKGKVIVSGYNSALYNDFLYEWTKIEKPSQTNKGGKRIEVLWMNYIPTHENQMELNLNPH